MFMKKLSSVLTLVYEKSVEAEYSLKVYGPFSLDAQQLLPIIDVYFIF